MSRKNSRQTETFSVMEITGGSEIWDMGVLYNGVGWFLGENLFEEKVLPNPLSKTFLGGCCRFV